MKTMIKYQKLPFHFSAKQMQQEVSALSSQWIAHYNQRDYEGSWTALPLRSINGAMDNVLADGAENAVFNNTVLMEQCPYLQSVVNTLQCEKRSVRLLNLQAGAVIKEHKDVELSFESGEARIHVPVMTNDAVGFYLDNERVVLDEGDCWYMNFNLKHRVTNAGNTDRIHLVMDCVVNDWMQELFTTGDWEIKSIVNAPEMYTAHEKNEIIKSLVLMNTPESLRMAQELEMSA